MKKNNIVLLERDNQYCAYNIENYGIYKLPEFTFTVLSYLFNNNIDTTSKKFEVSAEEIRQVLEQIAYNPNYTIRTSEYTCPTRRKIQRITLHISNDCNLRCKYCYAEGGSYNQSRSLMAHETAVQFVEYCCKNYSSVENIVFFGGEPFLNISVMETVCQLFNEKYRNKQIDFIPKFGAITNGTISNDHAINLIKNYFSFITVSVDGPKDIHDANRVGINNKGSFDSVDLFINKIRNIKNLTIGIEATFTLQHIKHGYNHESIRDFFKHTYALDADVVDEISIDRENMESENMDKPLESPWFSSILATIIHKRPETKCDIVRSNIAISSDGLLYPCHMNVGDGMKPISSIWDSGDIVVDELNNKPNYRLKDNPSCAECWAANFCGGCSRNWFYDAQKKEYSVNPEPKRCEKFRNITKFALLKICEIRRDPVQWREMLDKLNQKPPEI